MTDAVCLITAPVSTDFEDAEEAQSRQVLAIARAPKLGVLALAAVLEQRQLHPCVFDLDDAYAVYVAEHPKGGLEVFPAWIAPQIVSTGARLFGFSTICSSYPITVRIAQAVKRLAPASTILFGGPQASVVDVSTLSAFPFVDFVLRGEADFSLPLFLDQWNGPAQWTEVPGLTWRSPFGPQRNPSAPVIDDLDELPLPALHHSKNLKDADYAFLELGRGCPFACTFCSTNDFFRRKFRVKSPARMLADMRYVAAYYGFRGFNLVHDMFTVDRRKVVAFCEAMIASGEGFKWSCSARTDCVDDALLELMAKAGCNDIFFGVETGSKRMQRIIDKGLDADQSRAAVDTADRLGVTTTVSLIGGFPEETAADLHETVDIFMHSLRHPLSTPQFNILAPLAGTPIHLQYKDRMILDELPSQLSYPGRDQSGSDRKLVRDHPDIFPNFYLLPTPGLDRGSLLELAEFLPMCRKRLRWLLVAIHQRNSGILEFFRAWREHRLRLHPGMEGGLLRQYYTLDTSRNELVRFVRDRMAEFGDPAVEALLGYEDTMARAIACAPSRPANLAASGRIASSHIVARAQGVHVIELCFDIQDVVNGLMRAEIPVIERTRKYYRTADQVGGETRLIEITPLVAQSLSLCDGARTVEDFTAHARQLFDCPDELCNYAALELLKRLRKEELIEVYGMPRKKRSRSSMPSRARVLSRANAASSSALPISEIGAKP